MIEDEEEIRRQLEIELKRFAIPSEHAVSTDRSMTLGEMQAALAKLRKANKSSADLIKEGEEGQL